jgi:hypothetical protein
MKRTISLPNLMLRLGLLLATTSSLARGYTGAGLLQAVSPGCARGVDECSQVVDPSAKVPPKLFWVVIPKDIENLYRVAVERGERPSREGHMFLEFRSGGFRQYVTLTLTPGLLGGFVAIERIDFIQEQWQVNPLGQDEIDQWVISANGNGTAHNVWHRRLLEDNGAVLKEEFQPTDEDSARAIVEKIVARFLTPMLNAVRYCAPADRLRKHAADGRLAAGPGSPLQAKIPRTWQQAEDSCIARRLPHPRSFQNGIRRKIFLSLSQTNPLTTAYP